MNLVRHALSLFAIILMTIAPASGQWVNIIADDNQAHQTEPHVSASPTNPNQCLSAWIDFRNLPSGNTIGYGFSTNGGDSWSSSPLTLPGNYTAAFDPSTTIANNGRGFLCYLAGYWPSLSSLGAIYVSHTTNNGPPWSHHQVSSAETYQDKPWIAVDNSGGARNGWIYVCWTSFSNQKMAIKVRASSDNGANWLDEKELAVSGTIPEYGHLAAALIPVRLGQDDPRDFPIYHGAVAAVAPNGDALVAWLEGQNGYSNVLASIRVARSTDGGDNWVKYYAVEGFKQAFKHEIGAFRCSSIPTLAIDPSNGTAYIAYVVYNSEDDFDVHMTRSTTGGTSWSTPIRVNQSSTGRQFFPAVAVSPTHTMTVAYCSQNQDGTLDVYAANSYNGGVSFYPTDQLVSSSPINPDYSADRLTDYHGVVSPTNNRHLAIWTDTRNRNSDPCVGVSSAPAPPSGISIAGTTGQHPTISWSANVESDLSGYKVYRKITPDESTYSLIATLGTGSLSYTDLDCTIRTGTGGQWALYYVKAYNSGSDLSDASSTVMKPVNYNPAKVGGDEGEPSKENGPVEFRFEQWYPNPFNPSSRLNFTLPVDSRVHIVITDLLGREVATLADGMRAAGKHSVVWNARSVTSGVYFARLDINDEAGNLLYKNTAKLVLTK